LGPNDPDILRTVVFPPGDVAYKVRQGTIPWPRGLPEP